MFHSVSALRVSLATGLLLATSASLPAWAAAQKTPETRLLERAVRLLPEPPSVPVRLIDPDLTPDPDALRHLDAFLVREPNGKVRQVIYLNRRTAIIENALAGKDVDVAILAAVVRHELEHLRGGGEREARRAERDLFQRLIFVGKVPVAEGLAYLADLEQDRQIRQIREGR
jgi:hypothetical protein